MPFRNLLAESASGFSATCMRKAIRTTQCRDIPDVITGGTIVPHGCPSVQRQIPNYLGLESIILELKFFKLSEIQF